MDTHIVDDPDSEQFRLAVGTLKMLADHTRLQIVWTLLHGEHSVGAIAEHIGCQPAAVSQHLAKLRLAHLVQVRREGNRLFYAADDAHVRHLVEEALFHSHHVVAGLDDQEAPVVAERVRRRRA